MAVFRYRMQNILELKKKFEEQARNEYARKLAVVNEEEEKLRTRIAEREAIEAEGQKLRLDRIDPLAIRDNAHARDFAEDEVKRQRVKLRVAEKNLQLAMKKMQEAMQERKIHEKLREKALMDFIAEENAKEVKEIDELTSYVFGSKQKEDEEPY